MATLHDRRYLVYCPANNGKYSATLFGNDRLFDVALHDYGNSAPVATDAEWYFNRADHKWPCIAENLGRISVKYACYAFLDDDIEVSTAELNRLFVLGEALQLSLFQPALTDDSSSSWKHLRQQSGGFVRPVNLVEIMMPFFSREALEICRHTFGHSESGWGLDLVWPKLLGDRGVAVVDAVAVRHAQRSRSKAWRLSDGSRPRQEKKKVLRLFEENRISDLQPRSRGARRFVTPSDEIACTENQFQSMVAEIETPHRREVSLAGIVQGEEELAAVLRVARSSWHGSGVECSALQEEFAAYVGVRHAIVVNSGSAANLLALQSLELPAGSKVVVSGGGFPATLNPVLHLGHHPILVDYQLPSHNVDIDQLEVACQSNKDARAMIVAHTVGNPLDMTRIRSMCDDFGVSLIEDCCEAIGSRLNGLPLGRTERFPRCPFIPATR